ncbi:FkbM family methyltransferase [Pseudoalteromonas sp. SSM20]|uniref:FkbM family methyltransferase n=1 Tax=Pseudoalteromonas sp. SSM20 TaxID=3139394 RepID=UPI003BAA58D7
MNNLEAHVESLRCEESFEGQLQRVYSEIVSSGDTVIDVGAHSGRHSLPLSLYVGAEGRVQSIEANPVALEWLLSQIRTFACNNVTTKNLALSNVVGDKADFFVAVDRPEESGLQPRKMYNGETELEKISVKTATLDELFSETPVTFIKIDVEGAEWLVLQGTRKLLESSTPIVAFEFGQSSYESFDVDPAQVYDFFDELNYVLYSIHGKKLTQQEFVDASVAQNFWDYFAVPTAKTEKFEKNRAFG